MVRYITTRAHKVFLPAAQGCKAIANTFGAHAIYKQHDISQGDPLPAYNAPASMLHVCGRPGGGEDMELTAATRGKLPKQWTERAATRAATDGSGGQACKPMHKSIADAKLQAVSNCFALQMHLLCAAWEVWSGALSFCCSAHAQQNTAHHMYS